MSSVIPPGGLFTGHESAKIASSKRQLNRVNVSKSTRSTLNLLDATSIGIINDYFSQDFDMFGYSKR